MAAQPVRAVVAVELLANSSVGDTNPRLSVIVPMLNEASGLANFLQTNLPRLPEYSEVILVDGGSTDAGLSIAADFTVRLSIPISIQIHESEPGRARQMNAGAEYATGKYLLFLHADTKLSQDFSEQFEEWSASDPVWGFSPIRLDGSQLWCRIVESSINLRTRVTAGASGDQAIVLQASKFRELGGYREIELMEDIDLSYRLRKQFKPKRFSLAVTTSNRRWKEGGVVRTVLMMWFLRLSFRLGVAPRRLARIYSGNSRTKLLIFAKLPRLGQVKTRLEPFLGAEGCLLLHQSLIAHAMELASGWNLGPVELWLADQPHKGDIPLDIPQSVAIRYQEGDNLGQRKSVV